MSADDYTIITKQDDKFVLSYGCASNDWKKRIGEFDNLEDAIRSAPDSEYGLSFDLDERNNPQKEEE